MDQRFNSFRWLLLLVLVLWVPSAWSGTWNDRNALVLPYVAVGGVPDRLHLMTLLILTNSSSDLDSGSIEFFGNDGQGFPVALNHDPELTAEATWSVPAGESTVLVITHPGEALRLGWLQINHSENSALHVITVVRLFNSQDLVAEAGAQASAEHSASPPYYKTAAVRGTPKAMPCGGMLRREWERPGRCNRGHFATSFLESRRYDRASLLNTSQGMGEHEGRGVPPENMEVEIKL